MWAGTVKHHIKLNIVLQQNISHFHSKKKNYQAKPGLTFSIPTARTYYPARKVGSNLSMNPRRKTLGKPKLKQKKYEKRSTTYVSGVLRDFIA